MWNGQGVGARLPGVSQIRPFERADLPRVAELYERTMRSGGTTAPAGLAAHFERTALDHPWSDPEVPSLFFETDNRILGFIGSYVRRLLVDDRPLRMSCAGQLVTDRGERNLAIGARL